jgi:hypothetical protein
MLCRSGRSSTPAAARARAQRRAAAARTATSARSCATVAPRAQTAFRVRCPLQATGACSFGADRVAATVCCRVCVRQGAVPHARVPVLRSSARVRPGPVPPLHADCGSGVEGVRRRAGAGHGRARGLLRKHEAAAAPAQAPAPGALRCVWLGRVRQGVMPSSATVRLLCALTPDSRCRLRRRVPRRTSCWASTPASSYRRCALAATLRAYTLRARPPSGPSGAADGMRPPSRRRTAAAKSTTA